MKKLLLIGVLAILGCVDNPPNGYLIPKKAFNVTKMDNYVVFELEIDGKPRKFLGGPYNYHQSWSITELSK